MQLRTIVVATIVGIDSAPEVIARADAALEGSADDLPDDVVALTERNALANQVIGEVGRQDEEIRLGGERLADGLLVLVGRCPRP